MSRDESLYLEDIIECCEKVLRFTKGMTFKQFVHDEVHFDAVLRNLGIVGEAVKHIPESTREKYPNVNWKKIAGFRDVVVHNYFGVSDEIVWDIVENMVPPLLEQAKKILEEHDKK
ncbi:MAG: DUF86 domain-containing protein [Anaerolineales bacterium]|nr:DUF86 domain-containing protein [Anaerolineales bacterium]MBX3035383.1 DUF86 domain-containing protein [Anaerolineales bacterium]